MTDFNLDMLKAPRAPGDDYSLLLNRDQVDWLYGILAGMEQEIPQVFKAPFLLHLRAKVYFTKAVKNIAEGSLEEQEGAKASMSKLQDALVKWQAIMGKYHETKD